MLRRAQDLQEFACRRLVSCVRGLAPPGQILAGEARFGLQLLRRAEEDDLPAALAGPGAHVENAVGGEHDLRVVLDDDQAVPGVAQPLHHADDAAHVARVQADRGLVEHEQGIDERSTKGRGEVDALHFAARQRARLPVERQVAEADLAQVAEPRADLAQHEVGRLIVDAQTLKEAIHA